MVNINYYSKCSNTPGVAELPFLCYQYTAGDLSWRDGNGKDDKQMCERHNGHVFTRGDNTNKPGCGHCWCCRKNHGI